METPRNNGYNQPICNDTQLTNMNYEGMRQQGEGLNARYTLMIIYVRKMIVSGSGQYEGREARRTYAEKNTKRVGSWIYYFWLKARASRQQVTQGSRLIMTPNMTVYSSLKRGSRRDDSCLNDVILCVLLQLATYRVSSPERQLKVRHTSRAVDRHHIMQNWYVLTAPSKDGSQALIYT